MQKKKKGGQHGGKLTCVLLRNSISKNNLISVTTVNLSITVSNDSLIKLGLANMRSLKNKDQALLNDILEHHIDVLRLVSSKRMTFGSNVGVLIEVEKS